MSHEIDNKENLYAQLDEQYKKLAKEQEKLKELLLEACDHLYEKEASMGVPISKALADWYKKLNLKRTIELAQAELNKMEEKDFNEST